MEGGPAGGILERWIGPGQEEERGKVGPIKAHGEVKRCIISQDIPAIEDSGYGGRQRGFPNGVGEREDRGRMGEGRE